MLRFAAARAGTYALNKPISAATPRVSANTKGGTCNETKGPRASALSAKTLNSPNATPQPIAPPDKATIDDSPTSRLKITPEGNPIERITAISLRRSRMDIAAVFAATSPIATTATMPRNWRIGYQARHKLQEPPLNRPPAPKIHARFQGCRRLPQNSHVGRLRSLERVLCRWYRQ